MIFKLYKDLFYKIYKWNLNHFGEKDVPEWKAIFIVSFIMFANITLIGIILEFLGLFDFFFRKIFPKKELISILVLLFIVNYIQYVSGAKYLVIKNEYESNKEKCLNTVTLTVFSVLSIISPFIIAFIFGKLFIR